MEGWRRASNIGITAGIAKGLIHQFVTIQGGEKAGEVLGDAMQAA